MGVLLSIDGDLNVANEFVYYEMSDMPMPATGYMHNQWAAGSSRIRGCRYDGGTCVCLCHCATGYTDRRGRL